MSAEVRRVPVVIVGGGPAGLAAAARLAPRVESRPLVVEREAEAGGIPRHSDHLGYGIRDRHRFVSGPAYARRLVSDALDAGAVIEPSTMVTGWAGERRLELTGPAGRRLIEAEAVVLATGARERPRAARLIPGDRPDGVLTTGQLQNLVHLHHASVGERAVVVGSELVSWSAVLTLREAGCRPVLMTSEHDRPESYAAFHLPGRAVLRVPVALGTRVVRINGIRRVESVELEQLSTGRRRVVDCDTVVLTGDWVPDHELVRLGSLDFDRATQGPVVDSGLRTSRDGVFAAGNLLHPVDTADVAALDGTHVAGSVLDWLERGAARAPGVRLIAEAPLRWVAPQLVEPGGAAPARGRLLLWSDEFRRLPKVVARQAGDEIGAVRLPWPCAPGRVFRVPARLVQDAALESGPVSIGLVGHRGLGPPRYLGA